MSEFNEVNYEQLAMALEMGNYYYNYVTLSPEDTEAVVRLALNTLAEASATELSKQKNPKGFLQNKSIAQEGGSVAKAARKQLERKLGRSVISSTKASDYLLPTQDSDEEDNS